MLQTRSTASGRARPAGAVPPAALLAGRYRLARAVPLAALLAGVLSLAACGGSGGGSTGSGASSPAGTPAAPATGKPGSPGSTAGITVRSPAFAEGATIPARFTCRGSGTPVPLTWTGIPSRAASVAVVVDDPDAPGGTFTHWVAFNLPATASGITGGQLPAGAAQAQNSNGRAAYFAPCPPSGTHHYRFTVYAEPKRLPLPAGAPLAGALQAIRAAPVASGRLTGLSSA